VSGLPGPAEECLVTEITIRPDGRVFVFGTSRDVLEVLRAVNPRDPKLRRLIAHVAAREAAAFVERPAGGKA
jgi:hypothetical protein